MPTVSADGDESDSSQNSAAGEDTLMIPEAWITGGAEGDDGMRRVAAMHTIGVMHADAEGMLASQLAQFVCGLTSAHEDVQAVGHALAAVVAPASTDDANETVEPHAEGAGLACRAAVRAVVDALAASGAAGVMRRARRM
eukprot:4111489-Pleurochrysis_carterae.AAC.1